MELKHHLKITLWATQGACERSHEPPPGGCGANMMLSQHMGTNVRQGRRQDTVVPHLLATPTQVTQKPPCGAAWAISKNAVCDEPPSISWVEWGS